MRVESRFVGTLAFLVFFVNAASAGEGDVTLGPTLGEQMAAMEQSLQAVGAHEEVSFLYYPEFIQFHERFRDRGPAAHGHLHDVEFLKSVLPDASFKSFNEMTSKGIGSSAVLTTLASPIIQDRASLCFADSAYLVFLIELKAIPRDQAIRLARNSALNFKELFTQLGKEGFQSALGNGAEVVAAFGDSPRAFIERKLKAYGPAEIDAVGESVEAIFNRYRAWKETELRKTDLEKVERGPLPCKWGLRPRQ